MAGRIYTSGIIGGRSGRGQSHLGTWAADENIEAELKVELEEPTH